MTRLSFGLAALLTFTICALGWTGCGDDGDPGVDAAVDASQDASTIPDPDAGSDDGSVDAGEDGGVDAGEDAAVDPDGGGNLQTQPSAPAQILQSGTNGLLLRGVVLTPTGVLDPGEVLVEGDSITCVAADCTAAPGATQATWIDTNGTISPGLIDCHNHMSYNFLPEWVPNPPQYFNNRYEWANDPAYEAHIEPYSAHRSANTHFCPASKWAELRSLVHGTTTMQGQPSASGSCINWAVRNANRYHGLGYDHMRGTISSPRDLTDADAQSLVDSFTAPTDPTTRYHVHMCEGVTGDNIDLEFDSFAGRDPRANRHAGTSLLAYDSAILIHSVILSATQLQEVVAEDSMIVWSPSSNFALYGPGVTAPIQQILQLGIVTGIGPDWTVSGEDEMLAELRVCLEHGIQENIPELTPQKLWEMATMDGAFVLGLQDHIGRLEVGYRADISVFGRTGQNAYMTVIDSRADDVRLVLIDGVGYLGDSALEATTARNTYCEQLDACGTMKYICAQEDSVTAGDRLDETMADIHQQLYDMLEGTGVAPFVEIYNRGNELLELVDCSI
ncbi:MAG: amidohydrolase family protein [bacterium]